MSNPRSSTWCPFPLFNLNSNTDGRVKLCCSIVENEHVRGDYEFNFGSDPIEKIWNSDYIKEIRADLSSGKKPKACQVCWKMEAEGVTSSRVAAVRENLYPHLDEPELLPTSLELRLGNKCNLGCMSCWSLSSSNILTEREKAISSVELPEWIKKNWQDEVTMVRSTKTNWYETEMFKQNFKLMAPGLKRLYLTGGEPTLIDENCTFLQLLLDTGNTSCAVSFTTNATVWNPKFYELISQFESAEVQISLDGFAELNDYIRYPSKWPVVERNLDKIFSLPSKVNIKVFSVISLLNVNTVYILVQHLLAKFSSRPFIYAPIILQAPDYLSTQLLDYKYRMASAQRIASFLSSHEEGDLGISFKHGMGSIVSHLNFGIEDAAKREAQINRAKDYILAHEKIRKVQHPYKETLFNEGLI